MKTTALFSALLFTIGLAVSPASFGQVKIGTNPATIGANSNLEVEAANNKKVIVNKSDGTVVIENTPVGTSADKLFTYRRGQGICGGQHDWRANTDI